MRWQTKEQLRDLLCRLVEYPSVTGSKAEIGIAKYIVEQLGTLPYFQENPDHLQLNPTGDGRYFVTALVRKGTKKKTVILVSHFDVVDVQDYGSWKDKAFSAEDLTPLFYSQKEWLPEEVQKDMEAGDWLFGRGTMDMKCGLALHMSIIEQAVSGAFDGNILLLAVPDEEVNSVGMRAAVPFLSDWARQQDLEYQLVLNSEPMFARYPGDVSQYIYMGSIGKILPGFLCYGKETHVGEPLSGLNANGMVSQLNCELELNADFCERVGNEVTPPSTNLIQKDLKREYSVQIPHRAVSLFNLFLLDRSMDEVMNSLRQVAEQAARKIEKAYRRQAVRFAELDSTEAGAVHVNVLSFQELKDYAIKTYGRERVEQLQEAVLLSQGTKDDRDITIELVDQFSILCKELSPMIVLFFAPPYYPAVCSRNHPMIQQIVPEMIDYAKHAYGLEWKQQNYFFGISDLSYVGLPYSIQALQPFIGNMPLWNKGYSIPLEQEALNVPMLNIGPAGRDAHKWTERLDVDYAFGKLPDLLQTVIKKIFKST